MFGLRRSNIADHGAVRAPASRNANRLSDEFPSANLAGILPRTSGTQTAQRDTQAPSSADVPHLRRMLTSHPTRRQYTSNKAARLQGRGRGSVLPIVSAASANRPHSVLGISFEVPGSVSPATSWASPPLISQLMRRLLPGTCARRAHRKKSRACSPSFQMSHARSSPTPHRAAAQGTVEAKAATACRSANSDLQATPKSPFKVAQLAGVIHLNLQQTSVRLAISRSKARPCWRSGRVGARRERRGRSVSVISRQPVGSALVQMPSAQRLTVRQYAMSKVWRVGIQDISNSPVETSPTTLRIILETMFRAKGFVILCIKDARANAMVLLWLRGRTRWTSPRRNPLFPLSFDPRHLSRRDVEGRRYPD